MFAAAPAYAKTDFTSPPERVINWPRRVAAYLDALPAGGFTPRRDWVLVEALAKGVPLPSTLGAQIRARALIAAARDDAGRFSLDGRAALIDECKRRSDENWVAK